MKYLYSVNGSKAKLIRQIEDEEIALTQTTFPAREYHENCHAVLSYSEEQGIYWEYIQFTPAEMREQAYQTERCITWGEESLTVDEANEMWVKYDAERNAKAEELTALIATAKAEIRERYPDENECE